MTPLDAGLDGGILALALNRPERLNALNSELVGELDRALERAEADDVRVVTITGRGSSFCSGADVKQVLGLTDQGAAEAFLRDLASVLGRISGLGKPVIVGAQGHAAGGGAEIALEADLRVVGQDARMWFPDVSVGSTPASVWRLVRMVGQSVATEMVMLGRSLDASQLQRFGVAHEVVSPPDVAGAVHHLATRVRDGAGARPLREAKQALRLAATADRETDLAANVELMLACFDGDDQRKAVAEFSARAGDG